MYQRNKAFEEQLRQGLMTVLTVGQMAGSFKRLQFVADFSAFGLQKVGNEWDKVEWNIQLLYDVINMVTKYLPKAKTDTVKAIE